ncbi:protein-disulfide reductase DsbD domain-containing protein [Xanthobacter sp. KR7-225]|uniref:protein-disulfide reductase DsbD domain-containing protein n=1 Tax=Xanthobacter sp. KR7-225 TaxID=3156613 RepID=UPI0032B5E41C
MTRAGLRPPRSAAAALGAVLAAAFFGAPPASAEESAPVVVQGAEVRLIAGSIAGAVAQAGLEIRLAPHWKTYWRYPGDAGVPPQIGWAGSHNVLGVEMAWPAPRRFADGAGVYSIGYKGNVLFPLAVTLADPKAPARLNLKLDFAVCEALCLPALAEIALVIDGKDAAGADARIAQARALVPKPAMLGAAEPPAVTQVRVDRSKTPPELVVEARVQNPTADLFVEGPDARWALPLPQKTALPDGKARFVLAFEGLPPDTAIDGARLTLTLVDAPRAVAVAHTIEAP